MIRFLGYGIFGWCAEILWTACYALVAALMARRAVDWRLKGQTYLWMFPIYAGGGLAFEVAHGLILEWSWPLRGLIYMLGCFAVEWCAGWVLQKLTTKIPWDYSYARWNVRGLIRLDYAPVWFAFGLTLERIEALLRTIESALG